MQIRAANLKDSLDIAKVQVVTWQGAYKNLLPQGYLDNLSIDQRNLAWSEIINKAANYTIVAELDLKIIGFANYGITRDQDLDKNLTYEITSLYVYPEYQSIGVGKALFDYVLSKIPSEYKSLSLWVLETNSQARAFYEKMEMQVDGARKEHMFSDQKFYEVRYLKKLMI